MGDGFGLGFAPRVETPRQFAVMQRQYARGQEPRILGPALADGERSHRHSPRHLRDGQQRIHAVQSAALHGHAEHGKRGERSDHARQVCCPARTGDDHVEALLARGAGELEQALGRAVGTDNARVVEHTERVQHLAGVLHGGPVGGRAHDDGDSGRGVGRGHGVCPASRAGALSPRPGSANLPRGNSVGKVVSPGC